MSNTNISVEKFSSDMADVRGLVDEKGVLKRKKYDVGKVDEQKKATAVLSNLAMMYHNREALNKRKIDPSDTFAKFCAEYTGYADDGNGIPTNLLRAAGIDPVFDKMQDVARHFSNDSFVLGTSAVNGGYSWLIPQLFLGIIQQKYLQREAIYKNLIGNSINVGDVLEVVQPVQLNTDTQPTIRNEFSQVSFATVDFSQKTMRMTEIEKGFQVGDKLMKTTAINMLPHVMGQIDDSFIKTWDALGVLTMVNGDQADGSEGARTVGVQTPGVLKFADLVRVKTRFTRMGLRMTGMLTSEDTALLVTLLPEFTGQVNHTGFKVTQLKLKSGFYPDIEMLDVHGAMPNDGGILFYDKATAMTELKGRPMSIANKHDIFTEVQTFVIREGKAFMTNSMQSRLYVDIDEAYTGFPAGYDVDIFENVVAKRY